MDAAFNPWLQKVGLVVSATRAAEVTAKTVDMVDHIPESEEIPPVPHDEASGEGPADEGEGGCMAEGQ